jgi:hypothetical protein
VAGKIYRPLFRDVYRGLILSLTGTYLAQIFYVSNLSSNYFGLGLAVALAMLSVIIYGCFLIYRGTEALCLLEK